MADALAGQAAQRAMAKVNAATQSDRNLDQMYGNGLAGMSGLGLQVGQAASGNMTSSASMFGQPLQWGNALATTGAGVRQVDNSMRLGLGQLGVQDYTARQNAGTNWYNAQSNRINANNGTITANNGTASANRGNDAASTALGTIATPILSGLGNWISGSLF